MPIYVVTNRVTHEACLGKFRVVVELGSSWFEDARFCHLTVEGVQNIVDSKYLYQPD